MSRVAVVAPLRPGAHDTAQRLIEGGPPFELEETPLDAHCIYLTDEEAVFVFEGPDARTVVERLVGEADVWQAATAWRDLLSGKPRIAETVFGWRRGGPKPLHVPGF